MVSVNIVLLMGHLTRNPELRYTPSGTPVASVGLAVNRRFKQGDEVKEEVCFVDCVAFGKTAETLAQHFPKGAGIFVEGRLQQQRWDTAEGQKRSKHEVVVERVSFTEPKAEPAA